ncbi:lipoprotein [Ketogulonicigenium robustum]|uniref:Lipoprotein n=1 Tax=Ketogulonicigenium robustum TaxID=92947 RepID=A0A1W6P0A4_9RHOB|nr:hypothetical protein [Ketogulonicigenium robustum]ARO14874.1 lipoprotein [Ketogulonicigenium robustum]
MIHFDDVFPLMTGRVHEVSGPLASSFAVLAGASARVASDAEAGVGHVLWVRAGWRSEMIDPPGVAPYMDPALMLVAQTQAQRETLAVAEEALRDGVFGLVVMELTAPLNLTAGRRLQLAAKQGQATGLCIIADGMGSPAAETRWRCTAVAATSQDSTLQKWELNKNKSGTTGAWNVRWSASAHRLVVVSTASE